MEQQSATTLEVADTLARLYIDALAEAEGVKMKSMMRFDRDPVADIIGDMDGSSSDTDSIPLRVDLLMATVLTARMIAGEQGLAKRLRQDCPVVAVTAHTANMTVLIADVIGKCALSQTSRKKLVCRDGTGKDHTPEKGNTEIVEGLSARWPVVGIAADARRHLPRALMRTAEYLVSVPTVDAWSIRVVLEAVTQQQYDGPIDETLLRRADMTDFSLSFRQDLSPAECLDRLAAMVKSKKGFAGEGPALEELDGYGEAKTWGLELVADLIEYRAGRLKWADVDHKGLLLSGPPGTGKTSFAKALAKSADVPLVATSVAQWNAASYLSGTLQAIRDVFGEAKRSAPAILFIDELDGISSRETLRGDYVEYWSQVVNLLLECLAGIEDREGVIVLGATNHPDKIDPAIVRAGRLDHHIALQKPDISSREKIFRHHVGPLALAGLDLTEPALAARGGTGADIEAWVRRAKAQARREDRELRMSDLLLQIRGNAEERSPEARKRIATHEAGHIVACRALEAGTVVGASILDGGGVTETKMVLTGTATEQALDNSITFFLAGRAAEILTFGDATLGSGGPGEDNDLSRATQFAVMAETVYGFGQSVGLVHLPVGDFGLQNDPDLRDAVRDRLERGYQLARQTLIDHVDQMAAVADALAEAGYLSNANIEAAIKAGPRRRPRPPTASTRLRPPGGPKRANTPAHSRADLRRGK